MQIHLGTFRLRALRGYTIYEAWGRCCVTSSPYEALNAASHVLYVAKCIFIIAFLIVESFINCIVSVTTILLTHTYAIMSSVKLR